MEQRNSSADHSPAPQAKRLQDRIYQLDWHEVTDRVRLIFTEMQESSLRRLQQLEESQAQSQGTVCEVQDELDEIHKAVFGVHLLRSERETLPKRKQRESVFYKFLHEASNLKALTLSQAEKA